MPRAERGPGTPKPRESLKGTSGKGIEVLDKCGRVKFPLSLDGRAGTFSRISWLREPVFGGLYEGLFVLDILAHVQEHQPLAFAQYQTQAVDKHPDYS